MVTQFNVTVLDQQLFSSGFCFASVATCRVPEAIYDSK